MFKKFLILLLFVLPGFIDGDLLRLSKFWQEAKLVSQVNENNSL